MKNITYGRDEQVWFNNEEEEQEAIDYILNSPYVDFNVHEDNQNQGAWGSEERIHFYNQDDIPDCLRRLLTAGTGNIVGRINCKDFCLKIRELDKD